MLGLVFMQSFIMKCSLFAIRVVVVFILITCSVFHFSLGPLHLVWFLQALSLGSVSSLQMTTKVWMFEFSNFSGDLQKFSVASFASKLFHKL